MSVSYEIGRTMVKVSAGQVKAGGIWDTASNVLSMGSKSTTDAVGHVADAVKGTRVGDAMEGVMGWGAAKGGFVPDKSMIQGGIQEASKQLFTPENTREMTKQIVESQTSPGASRNIQTILKSNNPDAANSPAMSSFIEPVSKRIGESLGQAIPQSTEWNMPTGLAMNAFSEQGNMLGFAGNKAEDWSNQFTNWMKSSQTKGLPQLEEIGKSMAEPFTPQSPAISQAADNISSVGQQGVDQAITQNTNKLGQGVYHLFSGNFNKMLDLIPDIPGMGTDTGANGGQAT